MKSRVTKLQAIIATGKIGEVEGTMVTPSIAEKILKDIPIVDFALCNMRTLCRLAQQ